MQKLKISYLLKLLDVSPSEMAKYINVDRSLVSKWKNAARTISINADYLEKFLEYLICKSDNSKINLLKNLFSSTYPEFDKDMNQDEYLINYLQKYLFDNNVDTIGTQKDSHPTPTIKIFDKREAELSELISILDSCSKVASSQKLYINFCNTIDSFFENNQLITEWIDKLEIFMNSGHKLHVVFNSNNSYIYFSLLRLFLHKNCEISILKGHIDSTVNYFFHLLENSFVFSSFNCNTKVYGLLFFESITIDFFKTILENTLSKSELLFNSANFDTILNNELNIVSPTYTNVLIRNNTSYYYNYIPTLDFMSEELYYDILCCNFKSKKEIQMYLNRFRLLKKRSQQQYNYNLSYHFYPVYEIVKMSKQRSIIYPEHYAIPKLSLSNNQFKRHMKELSNHLLSNDNYHIALCSNNNIAFSLLSYCWCKKNEFVLIQDNNNLHKGKISIDSLFVNSLSKFFDETYTSIPSNMKDKNIVAEFLRTL